MLSTGLWRWLSSLLAALQICDTLCTSGFVDDATFSRNEALVHHHPTNKWQMVMLKAFATDVIAISSKEPAKLPVLQVGGHYRREMAETRIGGRAHVPAVHTEALAGRRET